MIRGSILMMKPLPNIDQVYNLIQQEEKQRSLSAISQFSHGSSAFHANSHGQEATIADHTALITQHQRAFNPSQKPLQAGNYNPSYNSNYSNFKSMPRGGSQDKK